MEREAFVSGVILEPAQIPIGRLAFPSQVHEHGRVGLWVPIPMKVHEEHRRRLHTATHGYDPELRFFIAIIPCDELLDLILAEDSMALCGPFYLTDDVCIEPLL